LKGFCHSREPVNHRRPPQQDIRRRRDALPGTETAGNELPGWAFDEEGGLATVTRLICFAMA
jgi:hypothetical protein